VMALDKAGVSSELIRFKRLNEWQLWKNVGRFGTPRKPFTFFEHALLIAASKGHKDIVAYLLHTGRYNHLIESPCERRLKRNPSVTETLGTPLYMAARRGHAGVARLLLKSGANARFVLEPYAMDPLTIATKDRNLAVVKILVEEAGVHPDAHPVGGRRALAVANDSYYKIEIYRYLRSKGAKPLTIRERFLD
jgi:ankyrin repeat protein